MGSRQVINCTVSTVSGVESSSVMISWMGPGGSITTTNGRVSIGSVTNDGNNMYTRSLQFTYLMEGDEGTYTCNVMILDTSRSQSVELQSLTGMFLCIVYSTCSSICIEYSNTTPENNLCRFKDVHSKFYVTISKIVCTLMKQYTVA